MFSNTVLFHNWTNPKMSIFFFLEKGRPRIKSSLVRLLDFVGEIKAWVSVIVSF